MNKERTIYQQFIVGLLAVLGACSVLIDMVTPLFLVFFWIKLFGFTGYGSYLMYGIGFLATIFRAIKYGWLK